MDRKTEDDKIKKIIKEITGDITIHAYPIDRDEAKSLGLKVEKAKDGLDKSMRELYEVYATEMKLGQPFHPNELLKGNDSANVSQSGAYLEKNDTSYQFIFSGKAQKVIRNNVPSFDLNFESQSWIKK